MHTPQIQSRRWLLTAATLFVLLACQTSPTGRQQLLLVPEQQMDSMGTQAFQEMKDREAIDRDPSLNAYVKCVSDAITTALNENRAWEVVVFRSDEVNAFALPGGKIGVYTGILKVATTPDQLAAIIGHEVGHVIAQHGRERVSTQLATQGVLATASILLKDQEPQSFNIIMGALGLGAQFGVLLPFSRLQETESDLIGLRLMAKAGFDPRAAVDLWKNMSKAGGAQPPQFLSTHPAHESRIQNLQNHMNEALALRAGSSRRPSCRH